MLFGLIWSADAGFPLALSNGDRGPRVFFSVAKGL